MQQNSGARRKLVVRSHSELVALPQGFLGEGLWSRVRELNRSEQAMQGLDTRLVCGTARHA